MADTKISALPVATTPLAGTEVLPIVQSGVTVKVSVNNLTENRNVTTGGLYVNGPQTTDGQVRMYNTTTRSSGNKYGIRFADSSFETNGAIYTEQTSSGSNAAEMVFVANNATGGIQITSGTEFMRGYGTGDVKLTTGNLVIGTANKSINFSGNGGVLWRCGAGTPEGVVTAPVGSLFTRTDGGLLSTLYVKESGTGNTGWIAK